MMSEIKKVDYIYVVDPNGIPLMPTSRLGMVRRWLKTGQARWFGNSRNTIQFVRPVTTNTQDLTLGVDAGFHLGLSVVGNNREYYASESLKKSEKDRITSRRELRRTRRNRLRYRKARFDNRRRKDGWLAPSIQHRLDFTIKEIKRLYMFLPITNLVVEVTPFDNQKLANPNIKPWKYTQGKMHGFKTIKDYLLARDNYRDALDGKQYPASKLRVHHLVQRKDGGTNQPDNLVLLSDINHNQANHNNGVLAKLRQKYGIGKSHLNDAFIIAGGTDVTLRTSNVYLRQKLRNNNRSLQKFYDAKYIDRRDGKQKTGKELSSGRTRRSRELNYNNLRQFRKEKVKKGRVSIRRNHYQLRPHDVVLNTRTNRIERVKSVNSRGKNVILQTGKSSTVKNIVSLYHVNGMLETKVENI